MRRAGFTALLALLATVAAGHPAPNSLFKCDFQPSGVRAEYWIPVSELAYARAADPAGEFADYLLRHVAAESPGGASWRVSVVGARAAAYAGHDYLVADLRLLPPAGQAPRPFVLVDDAVTHEVRNHVIYVLERRDTGSELLGLLQYPTLRLEIGAR